MKNDLIDRDIFIMLDESVKGKSPTIVITLGSMDNDMVRHEFYTEQFKTSPDNQAIYNAILEALKRLWGSLDEVKRRQSQVLMLISDGAKYMLTAGKKLKAIFRELIHVTCVTHGLSLVCQEVAKQHPRVVKFISLMKRVMCNSPKRKEAYKKATGNEVCMSLIDDLFDLEPVETANRVNVSLEELLSDANHEYWEHLLTDSGASTLWSAVWGKIIRAGDNLFLLAGQEGEDLDSDPNRILPPHPVNTRFGTFIVAVCYYHHYLTRALNFISILESNATKEQTKMIKEIKQLLLESDKLKDEIDHIFDVLKLLPVFICATEKEYMKVTECEQILDRAHRYLQDGAKLEATGPNAGKYLSATKALEKFEAVRNKNTGLTLLFHLAKTHKIYDYSPTSSCRIERKFSILEKVLGSRRIFKEKTFSKFASSTLFLKNVETEKNKLKQKV